MVCLFTDKEHCSGCGACAAICPVSAIRMERDEEGFRYPRIDGTKCIQCGKCTESCPLNRMRKKGLKNETAVYAFQHSSPDVLQHSASGGAFIALADAFFATHEIAHVYGAAFHKGEVFHHEVDDPGNLPVFSDSKYLESDLRSCFYSVRQQLSRGESVLFSGTPCQVDGLKASLSTFPENVKERNLLLVEIVCNGVGSPLVWQKNWDYLKEQEESPPFDYSFRDKREPRGYGVSWRMEDGSERAELLNENFYWRMYISGLILRPSCYSCRYAGSHRNADITIGDFHGFEDNAGSDLISVNKGVSLVLCNTDKGKAYGRSLYNAGIVRLSSLEAARQPRLEYPASKHPLRKQVMRDISVLPYESFKKKYYLLAGSGNILRN